MEYSISILTVLWSMCAAACFMLALMHLVLWLRDRRTSEYVLSSAMAAAAGCNALIELSLMFAADIPSYALLLKLENVFVFVTLISLIWFVRVYLSTGSRWLLLVISTLWSVAMIANFTSPASLVFTEITELVSHDTFWGETFTLARGVTNPWKACADAASVLILIFLSQASWVAWRNGRRRRAVIVGGSSLFFIILGGIQAPLVDAGILRMPYMIGFAFLAIVMALTYQLVIEAFRSGEYAREMEQLSRATLLGEIAAGVAHEVNQPLAAILSNAQAARRFLGADEPNLNEIREIIDDIIVDDKRAGDVIRGLRAMLQPQDIEPGVVNVNQAVRFVADLLKTELRTREVTLELSPDAEPAPAIANATQVQQVIMNLVVNAARAMADNPPEHRRIMIHTMIRDDEAVVSVADQGPGISAEALPRIFDPFFTMGKDGLGMGLAICKRIIERHEGRIWARNRQGGGVEFHFTLPLADTESGRTS